jgi:hypothetical protein
LNTELNTLEIPVTNDEEPAIYSILSCYISFTFPLPLLILISYHSLPYSFVVACTYIYYVYRRNIVHILIFRFLIKILYYMETVDYQKDMNSCSQHQLKLYNNAVVASQNKRVKVGITIIKLGACGILVKRSNTIHLVHTQFMYTKTMQCLYGPVQIYICKYTGKNYSRYIPS